MMAPAKLPTMEGEWAVRFRDGGAGLFRVHERPVSKKLVVVLDDADEIPVDQVPNVHLWYGPMPSAPAKVPA